MFRFPRRLVAIALGVGLVLSAARGDASYVNGLRDFLRNAQLIAVVQVEPPAVGAAADAPRRGRVLEVLKGFSTEVFLELPGGPGGLDQPRGELAGGERVLVFVPPPRQSYLAARNMTPPVGESPRVWRLDANGDLAGGAINLDGGDGGLVGDPRFGDRKIVSLDLVRAELGKLAPLEAGLHARLLEAMLLGDADQRVDETTRMIAAVYDFPRDVDALAALLESSDARVRDAAAARLGMLVDAPVTRPARLDAAGAHAWREAWRGWWRAHRPQLRWDEPKQRWIAADGSPRAWPPCPSPLRPPRSDAYPAALQRALGSGEGKAFTVAVRAWLDAGVLRDRLLWRASVRVDDARWPGGDRGITYTDAPMPTTFGELLDARRPVAERLLALASLVMHRHAERFVAERRAAAVWLAEQPPCGDAVRRAAYWELVDGNLETPGRVALYRVAECADAAAGALLDGLRRQRGDTDTQGAIGHRAETFPRAPR